MRVFGRIHPGATSYEEGRNITIEFRSLDGKHERLPALAAELVRLEVDVIVAPAAQNVLATERATRMIPIVMTYFGDPVASGLVTSLPRPGGNVTRLSGLAPEMVDPSRRQAGDARATMFPARAVS